MLESLRFFAGMRRNFKSVGAVAPSSGHLGRAMVRRLGPVEPGQVIIELGPGTGPFTKQIRRQYPDNPILAVEFDGVFADRLQRRFPDVAVVNGCASGLSEHLRRHGYAHDDVAGVISGLPLLNFPDALRDNIFGSVAEVLPYGRRYVQFTYSKRAWRHIHPPGFSPDISRRIFFNMPPAVVLPFVRD